MTKCDGHMLYDERQTKTIQKKTKWRCWTCTCSRNSLKSLTVSYSFEKEVRERRHFVGNFSEVWRTLDDSQDLQDPQDLRLFRVMRKDGRELNWGLKVISSSLVFHLFTFYFISTSFHSFLILLSLCLGSWLSWSGSWAEVSFEFKCLLFFGRKWKYDI